MKMFLASILLAAGLASAQDAKHDKQHGQKQHKDKPAAQKTKAADGERVVRGEKIGDAPAVSFADVLKEPAKFAGKRVLIEGVVSRVCKAEGCWMQITPKADSEESVRVTFDHKFSVPKDSEQMKFRAEGEFSVKVLSKDEVDHLVNDDGAKIKRNPDGTANEVSFVATGVELWK